ncbi:MAG TPA: sigma-70 family RNA polymerase sigma factor [Terriglobales bacterium]|jgi:RNA polymerase sigma-70 factor (ECF subfamily)
MQQDTDKIHAKPARPDAELITRAQRGEAQAFETLFHTYKQRVYRLCLRMTRNPADAEEFTQEAFLTLFRKIHTFRGESAFSTWLLRISMNIVLMRMRRKTPKELISLDEPESDESERAQAELGAPDTRLEALPDRISLELAIAELPEGYRRVFELHDVLGHEHHEIAAILGYSVGNSKSQLFKARMRLRKLLGPGLRPRRGKSRRTAAQSEDDALLTGS